MKADATLRLTALRSLPEFRPGDDLGKLIIQAADKEEVTWADRPVVVIAQKAVSKVEGKIVDLRTIEPSEKACSFAAEHGKDPRLVELVLRQSRRIVRMERGILITETSHGFICANAGVDQSNVDGADYATVLPDDPDASARRIREQLRQSTGVACGVIISDTWGRPWRLGLVDFAIGVAGLAPFNDQRGQPDRQGRLLRATRLAVADQLAAAAGLLMGKSEGHPVVIVQGLSLKEMEGSASELVRPPEEDLFR